MKSRRLIFQALKIVVSLGLIVFLVVKLSPSNLLSQLSELAATPLLIALAVFFASVVLGAWQWHRLLVAGGVSLSFANSFRIYFVGLFFNNFLPAGVGGDIVKIYDVTKFGNDPYKVFATTVLDRVIGIAGLCLMALCASLVLLRGERLDNLALYILLFVGCVAPMLALVLNRRLSRAIRTLFGKVTLWELGRRFDEIFRRLGEFRRMRALLAGLTGIAIVVQFLRVVTHILVAQALGVNVSPLMFLQFFVFVPLLGLLMVLPVSINGLGVREGVGILLFTQIGFSAEQALLMELVTYAIMVAVSLLGGFYFVDRNLRRSVVAREKEAGCDVREGA